MMHELVEVVRAIAWPVVVAALIAIVAPRKKKVKAGDSVTGYSATSQNLGQATVVQVKGNEILLDHSIAGLRPGDLIQVTSTSTTP